MPKPLAQASEWLAQYRRFWETSFQRLDGLLDELKATGKKTKRPPGWTMPVREIVPPERLVATERFDNTARRSGMEHGMAAGYNRLERQTARS